jgi:prepilin-type N-terminal cleavage/methylation domain-containing protein
MPDLPARPRLPFPGSPRGFTLVEVLAAVGILSVMGLFGVALFQTLSVRWLRDDAVATRDVRHAISWFSRDAPRAETTNLVDGAAPASSVVMDWRDVGGGSHITAYTLVEDRLVRSFDDAETTVASNVTSAEFSRSGKRLRIALVVSTPAGSSIQQDLNVFGRQLQ